MNSKKRGKLLLNFERLLQPGQNFKNFKQDFVDMPFFFYSAKTYLSVVIR